MGVGEGLLQGDGLLFRQGMVQGDGHHHGPAQDRGVLQLGVAEDLGAEADVRLSLGDRLAHLAGHAGGELKVTAGVVLLELPGTAGSPWGPPGGGWSAPGWCPTPSFSIWKLRRQLSARATICRAWGEQGLPEPAQGDAPAALLKEGDPPAPFPGRRWRGSGRTGRCSAAGPPGCSASPGRGPGSSADDRCSKVHLPFWKQYTMTDAKKE